jgi:glycosyltransferase involved in cell wall biosynthesis
LHDLIQAYRLIQDPPFKLVIAGDTDHETDYSRNLKRQAAHASGVILTGFISGKRLQELYTNAGLFVLPSYYEGLPIALLEALSYELPVLVSDIQQHKEIPLREMRYFKTGNINSLSSAIMNTYLKGIAESEKEEYRSLIKESYNWDNIAVKTLSIYKDVIK